MKPGGVLGHLTFGMSGCQMSKSTNSGLRDLLPVPGCYDGAHQGLNPAEPAHVDLVLPIVAGQVGQDASGACHNVDVIASQQSNQTLN